MANKPLKSVKFPGLGDTYTIPQVDTTLAVTGAAADAKKVGDELTELKADFTQLDGKIAATLITNTASGSVASFDDGANDIPVKDLTVQIVPVQAGTGDPSPENVRPISGWTGANVRRTGKNLGNFTDIDAPKTENTVFSGFNLTGSAYVLSFDIVGAVRGSTGNTDVVRIHCADGTDIYGDLTNIKRISDDVTLGNSTWPVTGRYYIKVAKTISWISFYWRSNSFLQLSAGACKNIMLESGTTATAYEPSNVNTYSITFPTEAGTVYGGTLDVTSGVLTVDRASAVYDGTNLSVRAVSQSSASGNWYGQATLPSKADISVWMTTAISNILKAGATPTAQGCFSIIGVGNAVVFVLVDQTITTVSGFSAYLAENPITVVYYLAEPQTYQLTPTEVSTLLGLNNIWADCGDVSVDYRADTKLYIENLTAPTEDDMTANTNIPDATYFMVGNNLFLSTTTIPAGDTINPGTNCTLMNLASALNALNS